MCVETGRRRPPAVSLRRQRLLRRRKRNLAKVQRSPAAKPETATQPREAETPTQPEVDAEEVYSEKWMSISIVLISFNCPFSTSPGALRGLGEDF